MVYGRALIDTLNSSHFLILPGLRQMRDGCRNNAPLRGLDNAGDILRYRIDREFCQRICEHRPNHQGIEHLGDDKYQRTGINKGAQPQNTFRKTPGDLADAECKMDLFCDDQVQKK